MAIKYYCSKTTNRFKKSSYVDSCITRQALIYAEQGDYVQIVGEQVITVELMTEVEDLLAVVVVRLECEESLVCSGEVGMAD
jgi:hypothetical protein